MKLLLLLMHLYLNQSHLKPMYTLYIELRSPCTLYHRPKIFVNINSLMCSLFHLFYPFYSDESELLLRQREETSSVEPNSS